MNLIKNLITKIINKEYYTKKYLIFIAYNYLVKNLNTN